MARAAQVFWPLAHLWLADLRGRLGLRNRPLEEHDADRARPSLSARVAGDAQPLPAAAGGELGVADRPRTIRIAATLRAIGTDLTPLPAVAILDAVSSPLVGVVVGSANWATVDCCYPQRELAVYEPVFGAAAA